MKKIVDIITVVLLAAAFILAYYTGFVSKTATGESVLATNTLALISILGVGVLFGVGGAATAYDRMKRGMVTKSFLALFIVEIFALVGMIAIMLSILLQMFTVDNTIIRALYVIFAMVCVVGYVDSMLYSDSMVAFDGEDGEGEEEYGEGEEEYDEYEDDEEDDDEIDEIDEVDGIDEEDEDAEEDE